MSNNNTVETPDNLSSATSFPKYQKFPSHITIIETSPKQPLVRDRDHFKS